MDTENLMIAAGVVFILAFVSFAVWLNLPHPTTTTTTTTTSTTTTTATTSTTTRTTTTRTTTTEAEDTTLPTTTSTTRLIECGSAPDCGSEYYDGTYFCQNVVGKNVVSLRKCTPKCVGGVCKTECETQLGDMCNSTEICVPGRSRCVPEDRFANATARFEANSKNFSQAHYGYRFRLNYTAYVNEYEVNGVLVDVIRPDGRGDQIALRLDLDYESEDATIGLYGVRKDSVILWMRMN